MVTVTGNIRIISNGGIKLQSHCCIRTMRGCHCNCRMRWNNQDIPQLWIASQVVKVGFDRPALAPTSLNQHATQQDLSLLHFHIAHVSQASVTLPIYCQRLRKYIQLHSCPCQNRSTVVFLKTCAALHLL
ncbi:hypothetical protein ACFX2A_019676 [Malus domestica]